MLGFENRVKARFARIGLLAIGLIGACSFLVEAQPPSTATSAVVTEAPRAATEKTVYTELTVAPKLEGDLSVRKKVEQTVAEVMKGELPISDESNRRVFLAYFTQYRYPQLTLTKNHALLPKMRGELLQNFIRRCENQEAHAILVDTTFTYLTRLIQSKSETFHPAVRYHAMLMLGELNTTEALREGGKTTPPTPMAQALGFMLSELNEPSQIDAVRAAALFGIQRHIEVDRQVKRFTSEQKSHVIEKLKPIVLQSNPPAGRSASGHAWLQRQTIENLAAMGRLDEQGELRDAMAAIIANQEAPASVRMSAAAALGILAGPALKIDGDKATEIVKQMGGFAASECRKHYDQLQEQMKSAREKPTPGSPGSTARSESFGGAVDILGEQKRLEPVRRRLKQVLASVQTGLSSRATGGMAGLAKGGAEAEVATQVVANVGTLSSLMDRTDMGIQEFVDAMQPPLSGLLATTRSAAAGIEPGQKANPGEPAKDGGPAKPAKPADDFDFGN